MVESIIMREGPKNATISLEYIVPRVPTKELSKEEASEIREMNEKRNANIIASFSNRIISSVKRRMDACKKNMLNHLVDGTAVCPCEGIIQWTRKDGSEGIFNLQSYNRMTEIIELLQMEKYNSIINNSNYADQILKAFLNDPIEFQDHSDANGYRYSELITLLCGCHYNRNNW